MEYKILLKANFKRHKVGLLGVFGLIFIACLSLAIALAVWSNSHAYIAKEMERMGFGDLTAWVSDVSDPDALKKELSAQADVKKVEQQPLIHASYTINGQDSDSEGQLIIYNPNQYSYRFFADDLSNHIDDSINIQPGEIYISPAMISVFDAKVGEEISFSIARAGGEKTFIIKGYFEDPFMGSSMIGMKSFLICEQDFEEISQNIEKEGIDALGRRGAMIHIFKADESQKSIAEWNSELNQSTALSQFTEFAHSKSTMTDFMLLLQNIFSGFLLVFVAMLLIVSMLILSHTISGAIQKDAVDMSILKVMGASSGMLRKLQLLQYLAAILAGMAAGLLTALPVIPAANRITLTTTGIMAQSNLPIGMCAMAFAIMLCLLCGFIALKTAQICHIRPLHAIRGQEDSSNKGGASFDIHKKGLAFWMALRQLTSTKKQYLSALIIASLLVFLASMVGRVNNWLGADGKGLMDAFNPADHDIGVQIFGPLDSKEIEGIMLDYTDIIDSYLLAMPGVTVKGVDYTANVIDEPERFHILQGRTCAASNEVVLTETVAADLNVQIGDSVSVSGADYIVSGIYQCANDMGANIGMSREGYAKIGQDTPEIWCTHYFIADASKKQQIISALTETFGGDVHLHENGWPGLYGIINAMQILMVVMYFIIGAVILIVMLLTSKRLMEAERRNMGIYKAMGFSNSVLRNSFAWRFALVAALGSAIGLLISQIITDPLIASAMRLCGISNFSSELSLNSALVPAFIIIILFAIFAYIASYAIGKLKLALLMAD